VTGTTMIEAGGKVATLINIFTTTPETQALLVAAWIAMTESIMRHQPGFISANVHASTDGLKVVNYAQWESEEHFQALLRDPMVAAEFGKLAAMAVDMDPRLYTVEAVHHV